MRIRAYEITNWDHEEDEYCRKWFGSNFIEGGFIKCDYCKENVVAFRNYIGGHVCPECEESVMRLEGSL